MHTEPRLCSWCSSEPSTHLCSGCDALLCDHCESDHTCKPRTQIVTSFSAAGAELYGRRCVDSVLAHWPDPLVVYVDEPITLAAPTRLTWDMPDWLTTKAALPSMRPEAEKPANYIWNARRFAVKAFVWADAAVRLERGILVWLDGDTQTTEAVPDGLIERLMDGVDVAYLGRGAMHPENGFVCFRIPEALPLLFWCREAYRSGSFRSWSDGWTDCHALRAGLAAVPVRARDLTSHTFDGEWRSGVDAFGRSPLGSFVKHFKGPKAKREAA
jgi:hypothetical protein